jgi:hypothetical protein
MGMTDSKLETVQDVWDQFIGILCYLQNPHARFTEEMQEEDERLAEFVRGHPQNFERLVLANIDGLAKSDKGARSWLSFFMNAHWPSSPHGSRFSAQTAMQATLLAMDPALAFELYATALARHAKTFSRETLEYATSALFALRERVWTSVPGVLERIDMAPEMRDVMGIERHHRDRLILPPELHEMTPEDIDASFEEYMRMPIADIQAKFCAGNSKGSFLAADDRLGEVIWKDARRLHELGIERFALLERFAQVSTWNRDGDRQRFRDEMTEKHGFRPSAEELTNMLRKERERARSEGPPAEPHVYYLGEDDIIEVRTDWIMGSANDPFHTLPIRTSSGVVEYTRKAGNESLTVRLERTSRLIRRACFFEGSVPTRVDPELAARVLGLLPIKP